MHTGNTGKDLWLQSAAHQVAVRWDADLLHCSGRLYSGKDTSWAHESCGLSILTSNVFPPPLPFSWKVSERNTTPIWKGFLCNWRTALFAILYWSKNYFSKFSLILPAWGRREFDQLKWPQRMAWSLKEVRVLLGERDVGWEENHRGSRNWETPRYIRSHEECRQKGSEESSQQC